MELYLELSNPCTQKKDFCRTCSSHFMAIRPLIKTVAVHKKFFSDLRKDRHKVDSEVQMILDCTNVEFHELHKFEKNVSGNLVFRAKKESTHFVYCVNKKRIETLLFLRALSNFTEYKRLLADEQRIQRMVTEVGS